MLLAEGGDSTKVAFRHLDVLHRHALDQPAQCVGFNSSVLLSSLELSDAKVYAP